MKHIAAAALTAAVTALSAGPAYAQKVYGPSDIGYLAAMSESNQAAYNTTVLGVAKFSGQGVVFQNVRAHVTGSDGSYEEGHINIDLGEGWVSCAAPKLGDFAGIRRGDKVRVSGSVGGAMAWQSGRDAVSAAPGVKWRAGYEYVPKDSLMLLTGTCRVAKE
ncbi:hypothetical protein [Burkholderia cenocepacia]|uniref:hypothetical protein n=1 Tax=Burkholderia cenocepacia TaxID=95486 RepID=UPI0013DF4CE9|nr:hypothetical protein [Burkholderia cenocepacia]MCW3583962.1 hypothetical protein [Burkholderia cenocepacia]MCW3629599.1 hypothetical protein [Burkholderia cenocepacia]MCW5182627.1 hypothetical protein [Burkholderia cenocepacia]NGO98936.1 hypothetical protein [Burkholderia cenocepacia]